MDQGRVAACHAFGEPVHGLTALQPIGIYSIPEISYVGATEVELTKQSVPYEVGVSRYRELARGQIAGDSYGMLKLLVSTDDLKLLGVHIFGSNATEMVHIGQAVMGCEGTVEYLVDAVFNYPTFSEAYKVAALDVMNKVRALSHFDRLALVVEGLRRRVSRPAGLRPRQQLGDVLIERRRVGQVLRAAAAVQTTDHPGDGRAADPRRAAGAVDQARARQLGIPAVAQSGAGLTADRQAADARGVSDHGDLGTARGRGTQRQCRADQRLDRSAGWAAHPRDRVVGQRVFVGQPARIQIQRVHAPHVVGCGFAGEAGNKPYRSTGAQAVRGGQHQVARCRMQH